MLRTLLAVAGLVAGFLGIAFAQSPPPVPAVPAKAIAVKAATVVVGPDGKPTVIDGPEVGPDGSPAAAKVGPKDSPRLALLKSLSFDRRPSAMLKAWAPKPKADPDKPTPSIDAKTEALNKEIADYKTAVMLGDWAKVKVYLATLPDEEATLAYKQTLTGLQRAGNPNMGGGNPDMDGMPMMMNPNMQQFAERNNFTLADLFGLAAAAPAAMNPTYFPQRAALTGPAALVSSIPKGLEKDHLLALGGILRETISAGTLPEVVVARFKTEVAKPEPQQTLNKRQLAKLLIASGQAAYAADFLPTPDDAIKAKDIEGLNLLSRTFLALNTREKNSGNLEKAWHAVQAALTFPDGSREQQEEALLRAVELAPKVTEQLGQAWLDESFTKKPERGMDILATVGTVVNQGLASRPFAVEERGNTLKLMKTAVEALLKASPEKAKEWQRTLTLLAAGWLKEAEFSNTYDRSSGSGPRIRRDMFGNIFYANQMDDDDGMGRFQMMQQPNMPRPILVADVLTARPNDAWITATDPGFKPKLAGTLARLHLKVGEEDKAFPLIEQIAHDQRDEARTLVKEFLRVWTRNHDPNGAKNENRYSWFFYGYEQRAESIPLTRSKQERNLQELSEWVVRIKKLPVGEIDDDMMVKAFTACHSSAEVYKTEAIEKVFGPLGTLKPRTLAGLSQQMRVNLAGLWRDPGEQQKKKTNRKKKDIEAEVLRGYEVAKSVVADGLKKFPDHWSLLAAQASLVHDEINYRQELSKTSDFSAKRTLAFAIFEKAAAQYAKVVKEIPEDEQTNQVYDLWFYASLGMVDLGMITEEKVADAKQPAKIKAALDALPGDRAEKHQARFANELFTRMSGAKPHVKFRYLKAGFEIIGDHKQAIEAKKVFDYYKDLVTEIKLDAIVDGSPEVGHGAPFGVFVNIRHTRDIERESGGFGRYLQNQNNGYFSYNYGRPTADYRDRFEAAAKEALKEHFEVISVTFQNDQVHSRAEKEYGWRYTPYAYMLIKPRGPQVDKIPSVRLDLDFLDTSGYAVIPVETPTIPISCKAPKGDARPVEKLSVTQTLDERQSDKGILLLEVKAVGVGLVPDLAGLVDFTPAGFEITKTEDQGLAVKKFEEDADRNSVVSERTWQLTLTGQSGLAELPKEFTFATVKVPTKENIFQRYSDADLAPVEQTVSLQKEYGKKSNLWIYVAAIGGGFGLLMIAMLVIILRRIGGPKAATGLQIPTDLNAFSVLELLRKVRDGGKLAPTHRAELDTAIAKLETYYFSADRSGTPDPDLRGIATKWATLAA